MKKLLFLVLFVVNVIAQAQTITIGEGSEMTAQVPFNSFYNYSYTEQIFLANEIEYSGYIKAIKFRLAYSYNSEHTSDIDVFMKNVSRSSFADQNDYESVSEEDKVFSGSWTIPANYDDWVTIEFDTPFHYNGIDNLMIAIDENSDDFQIRYFRYSEVSRSALIYSSDNDNPNPYELGLFSGFKEVGNQRANVKLVFGTVTGVVENGMELLSAYPNPAKDIIYLDGFEGETINVYDANGRLLIHETYNGQLNVGNLRNGIYAISTRKGVIEFLKK